MEVLERIEKLLIAILAELQKQTEENQVGGHTVNRPADVPAETATPR